MSAESTQAGSDHEEGSISEGISLDGDSERGSARTSLLLTGCEDACGHCTLCILTSAVDFSCVGASAEAPCGPGPKKQSTGWAEFQLHRMLGLRPNSLEGPRPRYYSKKLAVWFREAIDVEGAGEVRFRQFLAALRRKPTLQLILSKEAGICFSEEECRLFSRVRAVGHSALPVDQRAAALLSERRRIKAIFGEMCPAGGDAVDLAGFLGFFLRRGLVVDTPLPENSEFIQSAERPGMLPAVSAQ